MDLHYDPLVKLFHMPPKIPDWPDFCSAQLALRSVSWLLRLRPCRPANLSALEAEDRLLPAAAAEIGPVGCCVVFEVVVLVLGSSFGGLPAIWPLAEPCDDVLPLRGL